MRTFDLCGLESVNLGRRKKTLTELLQKMSAQKLLAPSIKTVWLTPEQYGHLEDAVNRQLRTTGQYELVFHDAAVKQITR